jgi:hypothetical protein
MNPPSCRITFHKTQFTYIVQTRTLDSVVTTEANELMARIHPRMPVILHSREYDRWLDREETEQLPLDLLRPLSRSAYLSYQSTCASTPSVVALRNEHLVFGQTQEYGTASCFRSVQRQKRSDPRIADRRTTRPL